MTMQKFKTQNGMTLGGDLVDEETGEIININNDDFIVNGKHIQAGLGTWLREDSAGSRQVGFDATTTTKLDFYVGGAVEASLTASGLTGLENLTLADNKNLYLGTGLDWRLKYDGFHVYDNIASGYHYYQFAGVTKGFMYDGGFRFYDNVGVQLGTGNDFRLYFDGSNTIFNAVAGQIYFQDNGTTVGGFVGTTFRMYDSKILSLGSDADWEFQHTGTSAVMDINVGNWSWRDGANSNTTRMLWVPDGGLRAYDDHYLALGTSADFQMSFDGTDAIFNAVAGDLKIQDNGTDKFTFGTTNGDLTITGDFSQHNVKTYTFSRTIPSSTGDIVELGSHSFANGAGFIEITAIVADSAYSVSKQYRIPVAYAQETAWCIVQPLFDSGGYSTETGNDFQLEFQMTTSQCLLRARRASGATAGSIDFVMTVYSADGDSNTFSESSTTSTETEPTIYHNAAIMTMHDDYVDIIGDLTVSGNVVSPTLTGTPTAPTATAGTNTTQIATTAFVQQEITAGGLSSGDTLLSADGSVSAVGFGFSNDVDTGFYLAGTADMRLALGGSNLLRFVAGRIDTYGHIDPVGTTIDIGNSSGKFRGIYATNAYIDSIDMGTNTFSDTSVGNWNTAYSWGDHSAAGYQAGDADLTAIAGLAKTDGNIIVGNGSTWVAESGATARTSLGLGTGNSPTFTNVTASGHFEGPAEHSSTTSGTLAAGDMNTTISATGGITINNSIGSQGDMVIIYNNTAGNITLTQGTGVTLRLAGSTSSGNRTLATRALACVYYHAANDVIVGGTGVT